MQLFYDERDAASHEARGSRILYWLDDVGALPLSEAEGESEGFLFAGARPIQDYQRLVAPFPRIADRPADRDPLLTLDRVLDQLAQADIEINATRTWRIGFDDPLPADLVYPLFVRSAGSSLKLGGAISKVANEDELLAEMSEIRRLLGWDALILAREWCDLAKAGDGVYGPIPLELRTWIVDQIPFAWSFHYLSVLESPAGFPLGNTDLKVLQRMAQQVGSVFRSRLVAADFARDIFGRWVFIEAGPGSCAGTAHETVFKAVACRLMGQETSPFGQPHGGIFLS